MFYCDVGTSWILYHVFPRKTFLFFEIFLQVFDVFSNYGHSPVILFFSNFTFLGCFCFWMVEFLDFSPFKFTLSKLCKTYHLILQTEAIQKSTLCIYDYEHPTCYKFPRYILALKYLFVFFIGLHENVTSFLIQLKMIST